MNPAGFGANISVIRLWTGVTGTYGITSSLRKFQSIPFMKWDFTESDVSAARWQANTGTGNLPFFRPMNVHTKGRLKDAPCTETGGKDDSTGGWVDAESVFRWWMEDDTIPGQYKLQFNEETNEVYY